MKKKFLVIGATVVLALASLTGCGSKETPNISTEATVTDAESGIGKVAEKVSSEAEDTTEEVSAFDENAYSKSFHYTLSNGLRAYKEVTDLECAGYVFTISDSGSNLNYEDDTSGSLSIGGVVIEADLINGDIDTFNGIDDSYKRVGDIVEVTNSDGNKVRMFLTEYTPSGMSGWFNHVLILAVDNGIVIQVSMVGGLEISQDDWESFVPITEGWIIEK